MKREYYLHHRNKYLPDNLRYIFVLESPPASGLYFYDESGKTSEPLFAEMMKLLGVTAKNKEGGLKLFQKAGYLLLDATYQPVNELKGKKRNDVILRDFSNLVEDLEKACAGKQIPIILVKSNICRILEPRLKQLGFTVQNNGVVVFFPSTGQQKQFHEKLGKFHQAVKIYA
ncbi:MAG: hypothetical protein FJ117_00985 [Deltaproteobacteria bacterium]|nr:hypothetical protein [Deltaproteobacteria bacterium]